MIEKTRNEESESIEKLLKGKDVSRIFLNTESELCIEFSDKTRFFVNSEDKSKLDFSITGGSA